MPNRSLLLPKRRLLVSCTLSTTLVCVPAAVNAAKRFEPYADIGRNAQIIAELSQELPPGRLHASMICLDGFRFAVTSILGPSTAPPAVSMTQVYEASTNQAVPARCRQ
jgi:hypothetical protein